AAAGADVETPEPPDAEAMPREAIELEGPGEEQRGEHAAPPPGDGEEPSGTPTTAMPFLDEPFSGPYEEAHFGVAACATKILESAGFLEAGSLGSSFQSLAPAGIIVHPIAGGSRASGEIRLRVALDIFSEAARTGFRTAVGRELPPFELRVCLSDLDDRPRL